MYIEANMEEIERQKFNRELNISWVDENLPKADNAIIETLFFVTGCLWNCSFVYLV